MANCPLSLTLTGASVDVGRDLEARLPRLEEIAAVLDAFRRASPAGAGHRAGRAPVGATR